MRGKKILTDAENIEEVKSRIIDNITYYNGRITSKTNDGFTFKTSIWMSKSNPLQSVSKGEIKVYKEVEGIAVEYDISGNMVINVIGIVVGIIVIIQSLIEDIKSGLFIVIFLIIIFLAIFYKRYRILKLLK